MPSVLKLAHGSSLCGHYGVRRTEQIIAGQSWWPTWNADAESRVRECVVRAGVKACKPTSNVPMQIYHPLPRFSQVAVDVQTVTPRTARGNIKILFLVGTFTLFARDVAISDEKAAKIAETIVDEWISIFGTMETLLSDRGPNFIGKVVFGMAEALGVR